MIQTIFILIVLLIAAPCISSDLQDVYRNDYENFWVKWEAVAKDVRECKSREEVSSFLKDSIALSTSHELREANASAIETLFKADTECLLDSIALLQEADIESVMRLYVSNPLHLSIIDVGETMKKFADQKEYALVMRYYESEKEW